jgi:hypothetical protein
VEKALGGAVIEPVEPVGPVGSAAPVSPGAPLPQTVFTAPPRPAVASHEEFLKGVAVGAGLVTLGVVLGAVVGRRR